MKAKPTNNARAGEVTLELRRRDEPLMAAANRSPFKVKRILVPIDFSNCSRKALLYALPLAKDHQAAITLLYVVPPAYGAGDFGGIDYGQLETSMKEGGQKELEKMAAEIAAGAESVDTLVRVGSPAREIIETARRLPVDLIVISTHGRTGLPHVFLGSVAEHVVQRAPCPVLVVRENEHEILA